MYNKQLVSWAMYDFANTAFSALFVTFFYPYFIKEFLGGNEFQVGLVLGGSMLLVALLVPVVGVIADMTGRRVKILSMLTLICVTLTALVGLVPLEMALLFGFFANFFYHSCLVVYNSILPQLVKSKRHGRASGFGIGVGYLGTVVSLALIYPILNRLGWDTHVGVASVFPITALFFLVFALPIFVYVPDYVKRHTRSFTALLRKAVKELFSTLRKIRSYKGLVPFLLSSFAYSNATSAAIIFLYLYAKEIMDMSAATFFWVYMVFAFAAAIASYFAGKVVDKIGPKRTLVGAGLLWIVAVYLLMNPQSVLQFGIAGSIGGAMLGTIWTANRPMILKLAPRMKPGQFFGFDELADKFSGAIEPILFGWLVISYGYAVALWSLMGFFVLGLVLLYWVPS